MVIDNPIPLMEKTVEYYFDYIKTEQFQEDIEKVESPYILKLHDSSNNRDIEIKIDFQDTENYDIYNGWKDGS